MAVLSVIKSGSESVAATIYLTPSGAFLHLLAYGVCMGLGWFAFPRARWRVALALLAYGMFLEGVQLFLPYRTCNPLDVLANFSGVFLAFCVVGVLKVRRAILKNKSNFECWILN